MIFSSSLIYEVWWDTLYYSIIFQQRDFTYETLDIYKISNFSEHSI